jgi:dinuclear metal center YbgI/SA1388 family protein
MLSVHDITQFLEQFAPAALAEDWDNVGLLVGDRQMPVTRVMTCLTITEASAAEAIASRADLIVTHHPLPFRPLKRLTVDSHEGKLLWQLAGARISVYSPHTAFDSAEQGINQRLAAGLGLMEIAPLVPAEIGALGAGRMGRLPAPASLGELATQVKRLLAIEHVQAVGPLDGPFERVAVACGSAGEFIPVAAEAGCQALVTGEVRFHGCLEAESLGLGLVLAGHFASERFAVEALAQVLADQFPSLEVWASRNEKDPLNWL